MVRNQTAALLMLRRRRRRRNPSAATMARPMDNDESGSMKKTMRCMMLLFAFNAVIVNAAAHGDIDDGPLQNSRSKYSLLRTPSIDSQGAYCMQWPAADFRREFYIDKDTFRYILSDTLIYAVIACVSNIYTYRYGTYAVR